MALARAKPHARFVMCGAISQYNKAKADGPKVNIIPASQDVRLTHRRITS